MDRLRALPLPEEPLGKLGLEGDVDLAGAPERSSALEKIDRGRVVLSQRGTTSGSSEPSPRGDSEPVVGHSELNRVPVRPLEVVTDDLVQLDEPDTGLLEPACKTGMEIGAARFRESVIGRVTDQDVAEAEAVLAGKLRPVGLDQLLADECGEAGCDL